MPQFEIGNTAAEKWTFEEAERALLNIVEYAETNEILSIQQAYIESDMRGSTFHYLLAKYPVLESYKKDLNDIVVSRINKGALIGDYNPTAGIWRMKQLGERDQQHQDITTGGQKISDVNLTDKQIDKIALSLIPKDE